jgi:hypothetical protein
MFYVCDDSEMQVDVEKLERARTEMLRRRLFHTERHPPISRDRF